MITVPVAEELAFRGFLIRRLISSDFEALGFRAFTYTSLLLSSVAFGLLHGDRWFAGAVAGIRLPSRSFDVAELETLW